MSRSPCLTFLIDDDLVAGADVVAVQLLVRILHLLRTLVIAQILVDVKQSHLGRSNVHNFLQTCLQIDDGSRETERRHDKFCFSLSLSVRTCGGEGKGWKLATNPNRQFEFDERLFVDQTGFTHVFGSVLVLVESCLGVSLARTALTLRRGGPLLPPLLHQFWTTQYGQTCFGFKTVFLVNSHPPHDAFDLPINVHRSHLAGVAMRKCDLDPLFRSQIDADQRIEFTVNGHQLGEALRTIALRLVHVIPDEGTLGIVPFLPVDQAATIQRLHEWQPGDQQLATFVFGGVAFVPQRPVLDAQVAQGRKLGQPVDVVPGVDLGAAEIEKRKISARRAFINI